MRLVKHETVNFVKFKKKKHIHTQKEEIKNTYTYTDKS